MTLFKFDTASAPAARSARHLLAAVSSLSLLCVAPFATAQTTAPISASTQQTATQTPPTPEAPVEINDRFNPRVYGGPEPIITKQAPVNSPVTTPIPAIQKPPTATITVPATAPEQAEQQVNVITREEIKAPPVNEGSTAVIADVNPNLASNSELNSSPDWPNGIRAQFVDVIVGAPIMVDPVTCEDGNPSLRIKVSNVKKSRGVIVADLHDDVKENFLEWEKVVLRVRATAVKGETSFCMPVPDTGNYSVAVYHDKNSNAVFDKHFLGLPKERFGMSNNPKFSTKSPKFEAATFKVPAEGVDMEIKLRRTSDVLSGNQD